MSCSAPAVLVLALDHGFDPQANVELGGGGSRHPCQGQHDGRQGGRMFQQMFHIASMEWWVGCGRVGYRLVWRGRAAGKIEDLDSNVSILEMPKAFSEVNCLKDGMFPIDFGHRHPGGTLFKAEIPSTQSLLAFETVARHHFCNKAAEELCLTTGAVSKQVRALEDTLGLALFTRGKHGLALTQAGQNYLELIRPALAKLVEAGIVVTRAKAGPNCCTSRCRPPSPTAGCYPVTRNWPTRAWSAR